MPHPTCIPRRRVQVKFKKRGLTKGSFRDECDINQIVDQYARTGLVAHVRSGSPQYGEAPDQTLYEAACIQAEIRSRDLEGAFDESQETDQDAVGVENPEDSSNQEDSEAHASLDAEAAEDE